MQQLVLYTILENSFLLSSDRCIFWEEEKALILSDMHLGKTGHFRKEGIAVPQAVLKEDLQRFVTLLQNFKPARVLIIGDMFHSRANKELDFFLKWRNDFASLPMELIRGNHDILQEDWYAAAGLTVISDQLSVGNFLFAHDVNDCVLNEDQYAFSGHIHPGISISGAGRQSLNFPCFYFSKQYAVLPAYSRFTGAHPIKPKRGESVYAIVPANHQKGERGGMIKVK